MNITIIGPRSCGKSLISNLLAKEIGYEYFESDALADKAMKEYGGLDKVTKSGDVDLMMCKGLELIIDVLRNDNVVLDLAGGAISARRGYELGVCQEIIKTIQENSVVIGILSYEDDSKSIKLLQDREIRRKHFEGMNIEELNGKVRKDYFKVKSKLKEVTKQIVYVGGKTSKNIVEEIKQIFINTCL